jgi:hypothetical protein
MDRAEAIAILRQHLDRIEALGYKALCARIGDLEVLAAHGKTGVEYQLELNILWDHKPNAVIRILGSIDDGGLRAFLPLTDSRLVEAGTQLPPSPAEPRDASDA